MTIISGNGLKKNAAFDPMGLLIETGFVVVCNTSTNGVSSLLRVLCQLRGCSGGGFLPVPSAGVKVRGFTQGFQSLRGFGRSCCQSPAGGDALHSIRKEVTNKCVSVCLSVCLCRGKSWGHFWSRVSRVGC